VGLPGSSDIFFLARVDHDGMTHHEAFEHHEHKEGSKTCRVCSSSYSHEHNPSSLRICEKCGWKLVIVLFVIMISISYIAWFGVI
jgi:hypothetical protein